MTTLKELRKRKSEWLFDTMSASQIKKDFKLSDREIEKIPPVKDYGRIRYHKKDIARYLDFQKMCGKNT